MGKALLFLVSLVGLSSGSALNSARLGPNLANICSALQRCGSASTGIHESTGIVSQSGPSQPLTRGTQCVR